jgi:hypothetical protein
LHKPKKPEDKLQQIIGSFRSQIDEKTRTIRIAVFDLAVLVASWSYYQLFIAPYFKCWSYKIRVRRWLRYTALGAVTLSTALLVIEMVLELTGHERLLSSLKQFEAGLVAALEQLRAAWPRLFAHLPESAYLVTAALLATLVALAIYLALHNVEEARKPGYEYHFARAINSFLLDSRTAHSTAQKIPVLKALEVCHFVFKHTGIQHVSLHLPVGSGLVIQPEHVFPADSNFSSAPLQPGEGLAGEVFGDAALHIQYLPRMFFPFNFRYGGWLFPHTAKMAFASVAIKNSTLRLWEVGNEEISPNTFKRIGTDPIIYRSLLSVPVVSVVGKQLMGVLNLDFGKTDPLDKRGIEMALVFALLLGGEIQSGTITL